MGPRVVPAMVRFVPDRRVDLPYHWNVTGPVPKVVQQFKCGAFEGFLVRNAVRGKYRRQNNAFARRMRYPIQKWPYVPLRGQIVQAEPHSVLEVYEGLYEFRSNSAAKQYLNDVSIPAGVHHPVRWYLHWTYRSFEHGLGNPKWDENAIYLGLERYAWVITLSVQGGNRLSGADVSWTVRKALAALGWSTPK